MIEDGILLYSAMSGYFLYCCKRKRDGGKEEIAITEYVTQQSVKNMFQTTGKIKKYREPLDKREVNVIIELK